MAWIVRLQELKARKKYSRARLGNSGPSLWEDAAFGGDDG